MKRAKGNYIIIMRIKHFSRKRLTGVHTHLHTYIKVYRMQSLTNKSFDVHFKHLNLPEMLSIGISTDTHTHTGALFPKIKP